jgi:hypothetical protein
MNNIVYNVEAKMEDLEKIIKKLLEIKRNGLRHENDNIFLENCNNILEKYN